MLKGGHVYIMANRYRGTIYIGVTSHLAARIFQHRTGEGSDFCKRYQLDRLVYAEPHADIRGAIARKGDEDMEPGLEIPPDRRTKSRLARSIRPAQPLKSWPPAFAGVTKVVIPYPRAFMIALLRASSVRKAEKTLSPSSARPSCPSSQSC